MAKRTAEAREEVFTDQEETKDVQEKRIEFFKQKGDQQFTKEGRNAEIIDLVLQAWAKMTDNKVSGPEEKVSSEMIKILPLGKIYTITRCLQDRFVGQMDAPSWWKICETGLPAKSGCRTKEGNQELQSDCTHQCHVEVVRVLCNDAHGKGEGARGLEKSSCWRSQQDKLERTPMMRHGSVVRPTMFLASLDIKTAFDEARSRHVAKNMESHNTLGW